MSVQERILQITIVSQDSFQQKEITTESIPGWKNIALPLLNFAFCCANNIHTVHKLVHICIDEEPLDYMFTYLLQPITSKLW